MGDIVKIFSNLEDILIINDELCSMLEQRTELGHFEFFPNILESNVGSDSCFVAFVVSLSSGSHAPSTTGGASPSRQPTARWLSAAELVFGKALCFLVGAGKRKSNS